VGCFLPIRGCPTIKTVGCFLLQNLRLKIR
jgi:hypothetical protein